MTAFVVAAVLGAVGFIALLIPPWRQWHAHRRQADAVDEAQADAYWAGLAALPWDADPEQHAADVDRHSRSAQAARHARTAADQPHGTTPRRYP